MNPSKKGLKMKLQKEIEKLFDFELIPSKEGFKKIFEILLEKFYSDDHLNLYSVVSNYDELDQFLRTL